jgi:16S rRNA (guanine527-N7)-methyltransferase
LSPAPAAAEPASQPEPVPAAASEVFGDRLGVAEQFAELLVTDGVLRGVIGPREPQRIWTRHLLNCAVLSELFEAERRVVDVGSGAGLPGLVLAIRRPDLRLDLVEPLHRRLTFLTDTVTALGLTGQVRVIRGRAEERVVVATAGNAAWVTARAVAPLDRLVTWCLPLLAPDGHLALMKGSSVADEVDHHRRALAAAGGTHPRVVRCGVGAVEPPVSVVILGVARRHPQRKGKR